jgi:hypothetical protein
MAAPPDEPDEVDEDTDDTGTATPSGMLGGIGRFLGGRSPGATSAPRTPPASSPRGKRRAMERLDDRERRYSMAATLAAAVFAVLIYVSETHNHHFHLAKGQLTPQTTLTLGVGAALLLGVATYFGRRAPVAFVCLFTFFIFSNGGGIIVGLPFIGLGGWLLYRSFQTQRRAAAGDRDTSAARNEPSSRAASTRSAPARDKPASRAKGPARPVANKRFTPKRPPPPAPKPSRRERKAAGATD